MNQKNERRRYYRINDVVGLTYEVLGKDDAAQSAQSGNLGLSVTNLLAEIDHEFNQATNAVWLENPSVAQALGLLNKKLSIIAAHSLQTDDQSIDSYDEMMVNISGCGVAFDCSEALDIGTRLQLSLVLKPSHTHLHVTGEVVAIEQQPSSVEKPYSVRINFDENSLVQEQLIQHIVQKQCAQIGSKVPTLEPEDQ